MKKIKASYATYNKEDLKKSLKNINFELSKARLQSQDGTKQKDARQKMRYEIALISTLLNK